MLPVLHSSGQDGSGGVVVWVGFADGVVFAYKAAMPESDGGIPPPTLLRECHAHHSGLQVRHSQCRKYGLSSNKMDLIASDCGHLQAMTVFTVTSRRPQCKLVTASSHGDPRCDLY